MPAYEVRPCSGQTKAASGWWCILLHLISMDRGPLPAVFERHSRMDAAADPFQIADLPVDWTTCPASKNGSAATHVSCSAAAAAASCNPASGQQRHASIPTSAHRLGCCSASLTCSCVLQARFHYRRTHFPVIAGEGDVAITIHEGNIRVLSRHAQHLRGHACQRRSKHASDAGQELDLLGLGHHS